MRFATDESPRGRDAVIMELSKALVEKRGRRGLYTPPSDENGTVAVGLAHETNDAAENEARADVLGAPEDVTQART